MRKRKRDQKAKETFSIGQYRPVNILTIRENLNHKIHIMNIDYNGQEDIYRSIYLTIYTIYLTITGSKENWVISAEFILSKEI